MTWLKKYKIKKIKKIKQKLRTFAIQYIGNDKNKQSAM